MISITIFFGDREIQHFITEKKHITIGRMKNNDICLDNIGISKIHARIAEIDGIYLLKDCDSTNGTLHNNRRIEAIQPLEEGDVIGIVKYYLVVSFPNSKDGRTNIDAYPKTLGLYDLKK